MIAGLVGHYRVVATVGQGGMGVVYKAIDTQLNRPVALKTLPTEVGIPAEASARLRAEALAAGCPTVLEHILSAIQDTESRLERIPRGMIRCEWPYVQVGNECRLP